METAFIEQFLFLNALAFLAVILAALARSQRNLLRLYWLQSLAVTLALLAAAQASGTQGLYWVAVLTFLAKCILAPLFFSRVLRVSGAPNASGQLLTLPWTLLALLVLVLTAYSGTFESLGLYLPGALGPVSLNIAMVFVAIFTMINARGAFAQMLGMLALENAIVLLGLLFGIESPLALELGVIFDILVWILISSAFISMIYRQFASLDTAHLRHLTED